MNPLADASTTAGGREGRRVGYALGFAPGSNMKLYDFQMAPNPRRVRVYLAEKGIEVETVQVDIPSGENLGEEFRAINPRSLLP